MNLFVLNNQLIQYVLAAEAKEAFHIADEDSIVLVRSKKFSTEQIREFGAWKEIYYLDLPALSGFKSYIETARVHEKAVRDILVQHRGVQRIFLGNYFNETMRHVATSFGRPDVEIIFLDEGIGTLHLYKSREQNATGTLKTDFASRLKNKLNYATKEIFYSVHCGDVPFRITFFTEYELSSTVLTRIVKNNFDKVKRQVSSYRVDERIYFIGCNNLVKVGAFSQKIYEDALRFVLRTYEGRQLVYVPHPRESVQAYTDLCSRLDMELLVTDLPIELYFVKEKKIPALVSGFISTAILTCYRLFGTATEYHSFKIPIDYVLSHHDIFTNVYQQYNDEFNGNSFKYFTVKI